MFTGLVRAIGQLEQVAPTEAGASLLISSPLNPSPQLGDSIAVNGVCLTVAKIMANRLQFDLSAETLSRTTLGKLTPNSRVNLEPALKVGDELGGHWVTGHVDGIARLSSITAEVFAFTAPPELMKFIAVKGSIALDGTSLTINQVNKKTNSFSVSIIPWTRQHTIFSDYKNGSQVNLEVDIIARYTQNML